MIDVEQEQLVSFSALAKSLPRRRRDRPVHVSTIHRWRRPGLRGVRLEAIRVGGAWHTTREAFARFCERLTAAETGNCTSVLSTAERGHAHETADTALAKEGW
jgi:hypothetical protein